MFKGDHGGVKSDKGSSSKMSTSVGSGSRPNGGKMEIPTSAPMNAHTLGRDPGGSLK